MERQPRPTESLVLVMLGLLGCGEPGPPAPIPADARVSRDAAPIDGSDGGPPDAFVASVSDSGRDAWCGQTEPDPSMTVQCSGCEPWCFLTREQPGLGDQADEDLEYDEAGVRLALGADGRHVADGRHRTVHDATPYCDPRRDWLDWRSLDYRVDLPEGTSIDFELRTASSVAGLDRATAAVVHASPGFGVIRPSDELRGAGAPTSLPYLSVTAVLHASADGTRTPVLFHYDLRYHCVSGM